MTFPVNKPKNKEFIKFANSLRCKLCSAQLDGGIFYKTANLYCVASNHYACDLSAEFNIPISETARITFNTTEYSIQNQIINNNNIINKYCNIYKSDLNLIKRLRKKIHIVHIEELLEIKDLSFKSEDELLNFIKVYNIFT